MRAALAVIKHLALGVPSGGQPQHTDPQAVAIQDINGLFRGLLPRRVGIVADDHFPGIFAEQPRLFVGKGRPAGSHRAVKTRLVQGDDIDVSLTQDELIRLGFFGQVHGIERAGFAVDRSVRAVDILPSVTVAVNDAAAESHHVPPDVDDGENHPAPEKGIQLAAFGSSRQPGRFQLQVGIALLPHSTQEAVPVILGIAQAEPYDSLGRHAPVQQVLQGLPTPGTDEGLVKIPGGVPVEGQQTLALQPAPAAVLLLGQLHAVHLRQLAHRIDVGQVFDLHEEVDGVSPLAAAKALEKLLVLLHVEGGRLFMMEGTAAPHTSALALQRDIAAHQVHDIRPGQKLVQKLLG